MLYYLFDYLDKHFNIPGAGVFQYISFRALGATVLSLFIAATYGKTIINFLRKKQMGETIRDLGLAGQMEKAGTPTMGGFIILASLLIPVLLFAKLTNVYIVLLIITALWTGMIGFVDDYLKKFKNNKDGLHGRFKIVGQVGLGVIVGLTLSFNDNVRIRIYEQPLLSSNLGEIQRYRDIIHPTVTTIPFIKNNEFDYKALLFGWLPEEYTWVIYTIIAIFIITAVSNGANITDGIDGLAAGVSGIIALTLGVLAYLSGNTKFSQYLNIMYIPNSGELVIFCAAFIGACVGFLWYNAYPAQVFMGDTGSLMLGGVIAVIALAIRKEWLIPFMCGIFIAENLSVIVQVSYFKWTKRKYGEGRRVLLMSPLHHHYQKKGIHESKIVTRFWIVGIILAILTLATLKLR
ncbi:MULTISPECIES: phospho-N-acetylmuramoyl-pentapeptide-transferase [Dyadobacter]|uniref:Phospho-N-acetylmuramoyl-pentapeptide-transferase n=1 Tax=Dyadobacter chenhuakuii TaxID=2909339 RepID=A0ABY4XHY4_9BACT|nr:MULTISPECIES: phospho-N-acetylmuramoyl-pentapeptide-transferase [Dyadobacter]MCE7073519.1 phospho-N-acetylmuramoyl-pentapeptide-transferase [Dyadobacter sp. CY327]MCF2495927.1 phospho-N-acetylmuramoyl-pentapeptide-transferase [Dyadobacter chenhuakuii]MCF2519879.1 phospho-N-acetylmuramoyl-pentapeptide-transferase [Dyadobacter sp. CY351]USJ29998.1 phospho-N-acetylmuramoyl-pentapeptide-transferase [Dyadobacter chenhuakuii]